MSSFPIENVRSQFPSLAIEDDGRRRIYLDNPAGTQVPFTVARAAAETLIGANANLGGFFRTSAAAEEVVQRAHEQMAVFLNAASFREIVIGQSMTMLTFHIAQSIGRTLQRGDEIAVTRMDHDGNIGPWLMLAEDLGLHVRWIDFDRDRWTIEPDTFAKQIGSKPKLVALNYASNLTGSVNDAAALTQIAKAAGALVYVDAVQYAPHGVTDVAAIGCDFLACSSYKFFGPHMGILWGRRALLDELTAYKVRPATNELPWKFELGTPQIEQLAAISATVDYYERLGALTGGPSTGRAAIESAFSACRRWEAGLADRLISGLERLPGVRIAGITDRARFAQRVPTISFTHEALPASRVARRLAEENIFVWSGHNYALEIVRALGIDEEEGVVRIGMAHYNTPEEIDETLEALGRMF
ncbi:MAG TPA: cysteine desulfurase-like protein [Candidatus Baltobacteraceae bacterium]|nr:cysteine desulfurase-like protein [Candidatus Baltobacteraceae bacterium]